MDEHGRDWSAQQRDRQLLSKDKRAVPPGTRCAAGAGCQSRARSRRKKEQADKKALRAQIEQLIEQIRLPQAQTDGRYNIVDGNKINKIRRIPRRSLIVARLRSFAQTEAMGSCQRKLPLAFASAISAR